MIRKTISMPDEMSAWVERRIQSGQYNNESEYFRDLVRRDQKLEDATAQLRQMLDEAGASGVSEKTVEEIWEEAKSRYVKRHGDIPPHG